MESFELTIDQKNYKIVPSVLDNTTFSVFNYSSFHTIIKLDPGCWEIIEHRFGDHHLPLQQIGKAIEIHFGLVV